MEKKRNLEEKIALFSVSPYPELESFAQRLIKAGWQIITTHEASEFLRKKKIKTMDVSEFTGIHEDYGFPPTLHPKMELALTTDSAVRIDLVYDIPYGIEKGNDVGGRTLLALAAKGNRIPVMNSEDMHFVVGCITKDGKVEPEFANYLRGKANYEISNHFLNLASTSIPNNFSGIIGTKHKILKNGENMYQVPSILFKTNLDDSLAICNFKQVAGDTPCFTNIADLDSILETSCKLQYSLSLNNITRPFIAVAAKHGNACGIGVSLKYPSEAIEAALWGNAKGIWGGEVITNFPLDVPLASLLKKSKKREQILGTAPWMLDVVAAPDMTNPAIEILSSNPNRKLFVNNALSFSFLREDKYVIRPVRGGFISQPPASYILDLDEVNWTNQPKNKECDISLIIAWAAAFTSNHGGNETAIAKNGALIGIGGGPSTFAAASTAIARAKEQNKDIAGAFFGADAFFPFTDVPKILFKAGCIGGTVPAGGKMEKTIVTYFKENDMFVGMIPEQYRGFCRH